MAMVFPVRVKEWDYCFGFRDLQILLLLRGILNPAFRPQKFENLAEYSSFPWVGKPRPSESTFVDNFE